MKLWMLAAILTLCGATSVLAQQAINTENGKAVRRIMFDRERVNITYADGTADEGVQYVTIRRDDTTTGILSLDHLTISPFDNCYDLQGRQLSKSKWPNGQIKKGVYITREGNRVRKTVKK